MRVRASILTALCALLPQLAAAQESAPVAKAFKDNEHSSARNLLAAAEEMPADKYGYKPTPEQMSFGLVMTHLAEGNDYLCGSIGGTKAPTRSKVSPTDSKEVLVARLRETFAFCDESVASLDDSKLGEELPFFGGRKMSRAGFIIATASDWADHYSQVANYLRLNGLVPPTSKKKAAM